MSDESGPSDSDTDDAHSEIDDLSGESDLDATGPSVRPASRRASGRLQAAQSGTAHGRTLDDTRTTPRSKSTPPKKQSSRGTPQSRGVKRTRDQTAHASQRSPKRPRLSPESQPKYEGIIPDWQSPAIPYAAWADIFVYAASEGTPDSLDTNWLIHAATTCRMFLEPALAAIYRSPPLRKPNKAKRLAALLSCPPAQTCINYRVKIESLYIEVQTVPQAILPDLIRGLPRLREVIFYTKWDQPPYRDLDKNIRWHYPREVFEALMSTSAEANAVDSEPSPTLLKSWEWSGSLMGEHAGQHLPDIEQIIRMHQTTPFAHLTRLSFTNFQVPSLHMPQSKLGAEEVAQQMLLEDNRVVAAMGEAISQVKTLKHLIFESSTVMNDRLLPLLPKDLVHLELINCWEIKSEDLVPFLRTHGRQLRILSLRHNQSLDLVYLTDLAEACPNLQELRMNLSYYRHHDSIDDGDPMYEVALSPDQVPTWPRSLRVIDFEHIRGWSVETAKMFLQSLIDQAEALPDLRHLAIKTILDIPWQERATMRREYREKMEEVFLRPFTPPKKISSMRQADDIEEIPSPQKKRRATEPSSPSRRSGRLATQEPARASGARGSKSMRHGRGSGKPLYRDPDTDEDEFDDSDGDLEEQAPNDDQSQSQGEDVKRPFIQGLCTTINITFDNQKVRELQYSMEDFRSEDDESEEEWNGDYEEDDPVFTF